MLQREIEVIANRYLEKSFAKSKEETQDRRKSAIWAFFGLGENRHMMSMSRIGASLGISREAVRQTIDEFGRVAYLEMGAKDKLDKSLIPHGTLYAMGDEEAINTSEALRVYRAVKYLLRDEEIQEKRYFKRMYVVSYKEINVRGIQSSCVKQVSHNGAVRIDQVCEEHFEEGASQHNINLVLAALQLKGDDLIVIPTTTGVYAYFTETGRNRLISRLKKIFYHYERVRIEKLRSALMRDMLRRDSMRTVLPPDEIILSICRKVLQATVGNGMVRVEEPPVADTVSNKYEVAIIDFINQDSEPSDVAVRREREIEHAVKKTDKDAYGFSMAINHSPLIVRISRGAYQMTGDIRAA